MGAPPRGFSLSWVMLLGIALAVGGAAALLTAAATAPSTSSGSASLVGITGTAFGWIVLFLMVGVIGFLVFDRLRQGAVPVPTRVLATVVVFVLLLTVVAVVGRFAGGGAVPPLGPIGPASNSSSGSGVGNDSNPGGNATGAGGQLIVFGVSLPGWALFAAVAIVAIVGGVVAVRVLGTRSSRAAIVPPSLDERELRAAFVEASTALDMAEEPRTVLIRLYGTLLDRLAPLVGDIDRQTAEEIRAAHLVRLGIGNDTAREITRLFEEARYSTHPIGPTELARAKSSIHRAIADLDAKGERRT